MVVNSYPNGRHPVTRLLRVFALFAVVGVATPVAAAAAPAADTLLQLPVRSYVPDDLPGYRMMGEVEGLQPVDRQMNPRMVDRAYTEFTRENLRADVNTYSISIGAYRYESVVTAKEHAREVRGQRASWRDTLRGLPVTVARETQTISSVGSARYYLSYHQGPLVLRVWSRVGVIDGPPPREVARKSMYQAFRVMVETA